jgi:alpha-L-fucosidase
MLAPCASRGGNLLLNIGPAPDGSIPPEAVEPLTKTGNWLKKNGECVYGKLFNFRNTGGVGGQLCSLSRKGNTVYVWTWIWPTDGELIIGGLTGKLKAARLLDGGKALGFTQEKYRIIFKDLPRDARDSVAGVTVIALEFEGEPGMVSFASQPPLTSGRAAE